MRYVNDTNCYCIFCVYTMHYRVKLLSLATVQTKATYVTTYAMEQLYILTSSIAQAMQIWSVLTRMERHKVLPGSQIKTRLQRLQLNVGFFLIYEKICERKSSAPHVRSSALLIFELNHRVLILTWNYFFKKCMVCIQIMLNDAIAAICNVRMIVHERTCIS